MVAGDVGKAGFSEWGISTAAAIERISIKWLDRADPLVTPGEIVWIGYDWAGRLVSATSPFFAGSATYAWRQDGLLAGRGWGHAGDGVSFSYDGARRPLAMGAADGTISLLQTYDRAGNVAGEGRTLTGVSGIAGDHLQTFSYDALRRLTGSSLDGASTSYSYDLDGNRTAVNGATSASYTYDRIDQLISQNIGGSITAFAYDAYGNMTAAATPSATRTAYAYDLGDRLTSITPPGQAATAFTYDALARIASRGADSYDYVGSSETVWRISNATSTINSAVDAEGNRVAVSSGSEFGWLLPDLHGNVALARNSAATAITGATRYDGYGQTILPTPWAYQPSRSRP